MKSQGAIRNPFAFYFPIQRGFSRSIQTLPSDSEVGIVIDNNLYNSQIVTDYTHVLRYH